MALWTIDLAFADIVSTSSDPRVGAIRMAWWRERLEELDEGKPSPAEPRLQAVAERLVPRGVTGKELSQFEDAWLPLLDAFPWGQTAADGLALRGRILFGIGSRLLGGKAEDGEAAGALWSLVDGAHHCSDAQSGELLRAQARAALAAIDKPMLRRLRPLTILAALAAADVVRESSGLKRLSVAVRHRLLGTLPQS